METRQERTSRKFKELRDKVKAEDYAKFIAGEEKTPSKSQEHIPPPSQQEILHMVLSNQVVILEVLLHTKLKIPLVYEKLIKDAILITDHIAKRMRG